MSDTNPPPENRRPLTLRDVSEASGVSEMTVSRVLRGLGDVSEATRIRHENILERHLAEVLTTVDERNG